jgi:hypothetical protein
VSEGQGASVQVHKGDLVAAGGPLRYRSGLLVTGSVGDGVIVEAGGDVYVKGNARGASIHSLGGRVAVTGTVVDTTLQAAGDILCGHLHKTSLSAGRDIHLLAEARQSVLRAGGNLHVKLSVEYSLQEALVEIGGGIVLDLQAPSSGVPTANERQHVRVSTDLEGAVSLHGQPPFQFVPCLIADLSGGGARCTLLGAAPLSAVKKGALVQLKFCLPGEEGQILAIARVARLVESDSWGLSFVAVADRDRQRLKTYCLQHVLTGTQRKLDLRHNRTSDLQHTNLLRRQGSEHAARA